MINRLLALFTWTTIRDTGVHRYEFNHRTGKRRVRRMLLTGYQPVDEQWVKTGVWSALGPPPGRRPPPP